jgi:hypothetical protein
VSEYNDFYRAIRELIWNSVLNFQEFWTTEYFLFTFIEKLKKSKICSAYK